MIAMEIEIMNTLNFNITYPNPIEFYNILSKIFNLEEKHNFLGKYFIESIFIYYRIIKYSPSVIASACVYLVMKYYQLDGYQKLYNNFIINEQYPEYVIKDAAKEIFFLLKNLKHVNLKFIRKKLGLSQYKKLAEIFDDKQDVEDEFE